MYAYHTIREKLRHKLRYPGLALDLKTKDLIDSGKNPLVYWPITIQNFDM